ncbi:MAG TPA: hypothetical protein VGN26_10350 [Armatimonadota bacterium]
MTRWILLTLAAVVLLAPMAEAKQKRASRARPAKRTMVARSAAATRSQNAQLEALYAKYQALLQRRQANQESAKADGMNSLSQYFQTMQKAQVSPLPGTSSSGTVWRLAPK